MMVLGTLKNAALINPDWNLHSCEVNLFRIREILQRRAEINEFAIHLDQLILFESGISLSDFLEIMVL